MPKGMKWSIHERQMVCRAWCETVSNNVYNEYSAIDRTKVLDDMFLRFKQLAPPNHDKGFYSERGKTSMWTFMRDRIIPDVKRFCQNSLKRVLDEYYAKKHPFLEKDPLIRPHIINIAVSMHMMFATEVSEENKDFPSNRWANLKAWEELCRSPKFYHSTTDALAGLHIKNYVHKPSTEEPDIGGVHNIFDVISATPAKRSTENSWRRKKKRKREEQEKSQKCHAILFQYAGVVDQMKFVANRLESFAPDLRAAAVTRPRAVNDLGPVVNQIYPVVNLLFPILNNMHTTIQTLQQRAADEEGKGSNDDEESDGRKDVEEEEDEPKNDDKEQPKNDQEKEKEKHDEVKEESRNDDDNDDGSEPTDYLV